MEKRPKFKDDWIFRNETLSLCHMKSICRFQAGCDCCIWLMGSHIESIQITKVLGIILALVFMKAA
jgi:hypothetical protein